MKTIYGSEEIVDLALNWADAVKKNSPLVKLFHEGILEHSDPQIDKILSRLL